jgi:O-antigen/teichoic acid export membrane protein
MKRQILKGGVLLSVGQAAALVLSFVRNLIIARLVGPENMGIAAGFAATMSALELTSDLGLLKIVIQDDEADQPEFLGTAHSLVCLRALIPTVGLFLLAQPFANWFNSPHAVWAFQLLALAPLIKAFSHLDLYRCHRHLRYGPLTCVEICSQAAGLAAGVLSAWISQDYRAVLISILVQAMTYTFASHIAATVPYRLRWSPEIARRILTFGWPLLINGLLMFLGVHSDRFIIVRGFGLEIVGIFAVASALVVVPSHALHRILNSLILPLLSASKSNRDLLLAQYRKAAHTTATLAVCLVAALAMIGPECVVLFYGSEFSRAAGWMGLLAALQAVRLIRCIPTQAALALGATCLIMWANVVRAAAIPLAAVAAFMGASMELVLVCFCIAELLALMYSVVGLELATSVRAVELLAPTTWPAAVIAMLVLIDTACGSHLGFLVRFVIAASVIGASFWALLPPEGVVAGRNLVRRLRPRFSGLHKPDCRNADT